MSVVGVSAMLAWIDAHADVGQEQDVDVELQRERAEAILLGGRPAVAAAAGRS